MIAEHVDDVHYINDILILNIDLLNEVLVDQLMRRLLLPIYVGSLVPELQVSSCAHGAHTSAFIVAKHVARLACDGIIPPRSHCAHCRVYAAYATASDVTIIR
jgi:hypothetical protein